MGGSFVGLGGCVLRRVAWKVDGGCGKGAGREASEEY